MCLIDATAFCYRAFYAVRGLSTSFGQPTNAIYGFLNIFHKVIKEKNPDYLGVCFDVSRDTFRQKKSAEYKIHRPPMPDGLTSQIPLIKEILAAYRIAVFEKEGFEADDLIATLAKLGKVKHLKVVVVSSDKDILQLVDKDVLVFSPYKDEGKTYDEKAVVERFGVAPERISDVIALMGDDVDNIKGVPGIGEKTAVELIKEFGTLSALLKHAHKIGKEKIRQAVQENTDLITLNKELAVLDEKVEVDFDLEKLKIREPDYRELTRIFKYLEFKKFLKDFPVQDSAESERIEPELIKDDALIKMCAQTDTLALYGATFEDMVFWAGGSFFKVAPAGKNLKALLANELVKKISHDLKVIAEITEKEGCPLRGFHFDTMIAAHLLNPAKPSYALCDVTWDYLERNQGSEGESSAQAVKNIVALHEKLAHELKEKALDKLFRTLEMPLIEVLVAMELSGITLDLSVLRTLSHDVEKRLVKLIAQIYEISGCEFNLNSPKQLREVLFEKLQLPVIRRSKTGPSTDEEVLRTLALQHALPQLLLEYRQLSKLKNTYIDTLPELIDHKTGKLHTSFNQTATETGRLSSTHPNLQNIPIKTDIGKRIRQAIIASGDTHYLLACDYSQIELRILAHLSGDESLIEAFEHNKDIHKATAALIHGVDESVVTDKMREIAKRVNFGIVYGLSAYGLSRDLGIPVTEAQAFIDAYFVRYPRVYDYIQEQIQRAKEDGFVTTMFSRRRYLPEINNKNQNIRQLAERQAINTPIQGSASDLIKLAMIEIHAQIQSRGLASKMILQVHDELVFDSPSREVKEMIELAKDRMEHVLTLSVPLRVEVKKGRNWLEMETIE